MFKLLLLLSILLFSGCAGYVSYDQQLPQVEYAVADQVLISVIDDRNRMRVKDESFIGIYHGAFGIPDDRSVGDTLASDDEDKDSNLAEYVQRRLVDGLKTNNWNARPIEQPTLPDDISIRTIMEENSAEKFLILVLKEWYFNTDLHFNTSFSFDTDVDVYVYDYSSSTSFHENFSSKKVIEEHGDRHNDIILAYRNRLTEIMASPSLVEALSSSMIVGPSSNRGIVESIGVSMLCNQSIKLVSKSNESEKWLLGCGDDESLKVTCYDDTCVVN